MATDNKPFEVGLVMAGAVSAGAYTAGVIDFLLEALKSWQEARDNKDPDVPQHDLKLQVMTGASAGGMTTALTAVILNNLARGIQSPKKSLLYQAWVEKIDIKGLLRGKDLKKGNQPLKSILDSTIIGEIANEFFDIEKIMGGAGWSLPPYIDEELKLYLTLSNLRGIPFEFDVEGQTGFSYGMTNHADYQYMELREHTSKDQWVKLKNAAIATGAFPVGLASQLMQRDTKEYQDRISYDGRDFSKYLKLSDEEHQAFNFVAVDGGMLNNEPIELARAALRSEREDREEIDRLSREIIKGSSGKNKKKESITKDERSLSGKTKGALIIIDPFPNVLHDTQNATENETALSKILMPMIGAMRSQSMFKPEELLLTANKYIYNRFMIAPIRYQNGSRAANPIASGFLGGFGGFLSEAFREHDYHLGRRNCQQFLRKYFVVPKKEFAENPVFKGIPFVDKFIVKDAHDQREYYPLIPLIGDVAADVDVKKLAQLCPI